MISKELLNKIVQSSTSYRGAAKLAGTSNQTLKRWVCKYNLDVSHFSFGKTYEKHIGIKYNMLTIQSIIYNKKKRCFANCKCDCGKITLKRVDSIINNRVPSCGCLSKNRSSMLSDKNPAFNGIGEIRNIFLGKIIKSAERRKIEYQLSKEFLWNLFLRQNKKCALSGLPIVFGRIYYSHETTASLDRIDSNNGYHENNVQWVHKDINKLKHDFDQSYFISLCKLISNNN